MQAGIFFSGRARRKRMGNEKRINYWSTWSGGGHHLRCVGQFVASPAGGWWVFRVGVCRWRRAKVYPGKPGTLPGGLIRLVCSLATAYAGPCSAPNSAKLSSARRKHKTKSSDCQGMAQCVAWVNVVMSLVQTFWTWSGLFIISCLCVQGHQFSLADVLGLHHTQGSMQRKIYYRLMLFLLFFFLLSLFRFARVSRTTHPRHRAC